MTNRKRFVWKNNKLYFGKKFTKTELVSDLTYLAMFWVHTKNGNSMDFYNISWAKQHAVDLAVEDMHLEGCS